MPISRQQKKKRKLFVIHKGIGSLILSLIIGRKKRQTLSYMCEITWGKGKRKEQPS